MSSTWNNTALQQCFCWDSEERTWCDYQSCSDFWQGATPRLIVGVSVIGLLSVILLFWVIISAVRCATMQRNEGTESQTIVNGYKMSTVLVFVSLLFASYITTEEAESNGYDSLKSLSEVVVLKVNDDTTRITEMQSSVAAIRKLPGNYVDINVLQQFDDIASTVNSYSSHILSGKSDILSGFTPFALVTIWSPAVFCLISFLLIVCGVHKCCSFLNVWFIAFTTFFLCSMQFVVGALSYTSAEICGDYDGVATTTVSIWSSTFGWTYQGEQGIRQLTSDIQASFRDSLCTRDFEGWEEYFSYTECGEFSNLEKLLSEDSSLKASTDRGECTGKCPISECATKCVSGSNSQQKAASIVTTYNTISDNTNKINTALVPLVTGESFPQFLSMLQHPLCHEFQPSSTHGNTKISLVAILLLFMLCLTIFIPVIFYRLPTSEYRIITNVEDEDLESPEKPIMFAPSAPVLR